MYEAYYGLSDKPFQLNPDPAFYFGSRQHRRAMSYLEYGLHQNEGFIVITGEIGAGKTMLVKSLLEKLDQSKVIAAHMVTTQLDAADLLRMVAAAFGVPSKGLQKSDLLLALEAFLVSVASAGKRCLLIVDEAQNLTPAAVEELRMLSNFQLETHALLQSFLVGQPEFRLTFQSASMEQLRQRVIATAHIGAMSATETQEYVEHRLGHVGWKGSPHFEPDAYRAIHEYTGGVPRRINSLCDRLLWYGYLSDKRRFSRPDVLDVAEELRIEVHHPRVGEPGTERDSHLSPKGVGAAGIPSGVLARGSDSHDAMLSELLPVITQFIHSLDERIGRLDSTLLRIERSNIAVATTAKEVLEWIQTQRHAREISAIPAECPPCADAPLVCDPLPSDRSSGYGDAKT